jgi:hypothetical protein
MILPEPEGRPVWEPVLIALFLAVVIVADGPEMLAAVQGRMAITQVARCWLEIGAAAMMVWGLGKSLYLAAVWTPPSGGSAAS